jgi:RES domain
MSSSISTPAAPSFDARRASGTCWRVIEAQHRVSTLKITDTQAEQELLENLIEASKPPVPAECERLHYLLSTPFRYVASYPQGSRFRRAGFTPGVFYASHHVETAIAETVFWRLLFYAESPDTPWPANAGEYTAFACAYATPRAIDLTRPPFDARRAEWMHPTRLDECQALADDARTANIDVIRYASVRDPQHRLNVALLHCRAFAKPAETARQTWRIHLSASGVRTQCEMPRTALDFDRNALVGDPRILRMAWERR